MEAHQIPHSLQGPMQIHGANKKQYQDQERYVGKVHKKEEFCDNDDKYLYQVYHKKMTNER